MVRAEKKKRTVTGSYISNKGPLSQLLERTPGPSKKKGERERERGAKNG